MPNPQRFYPHVSDVAEAHEAIKQLTDHVYDLRDQMQDQHREHMKALADVHAAQKRPAFTTDVAGIKINAATDPASLQNGMTLKYNAATGQFDFSL